MITSVNNLALWKASGEPEAWVREHLKGWNHQDWLELLAILRRSKYWPMEEAAVGQVLESIKRRLMTTSSIGDSTSHAECEELLQLATPQLYRRNLFRVLGLPVTATTADVRRQQKRLEMQRKLGVASSNGNGGPLALVPTPTDEEIRAAMDRLNDPEARLLDEVFWFWPLDGNPAADPALQALDQGQVKEASEIWLKQIKANGHGQIAAHNLAVLHHVAALDEESRIVPERLNTTLTQRLTATWLQALGHWREVLDGEDFWSRVRDRVREINDAKLTTGLVRRMRNTLPKALLLINATMAYGAAERKDGGGAERQVRIVREAKFPDGLAEEALREALQPLRTRIKVAIDHAKNRWTEDPRHGARYVRDLHEQASHVLTVIDVVLPTNHLIRIGLHDMLADAMLEGQVAFGAKTNDWSEGIKLLEMAQLVAVGEISRSRLTENITTLKELIASGNDWCSPGYWELPQDVIDQLESIRAKAKSGDYDGAIESLLIIDPQIGKPLRRCLAHCLSLKGIRVNNEALSEYAQETPLFKKVIDKLRAMDESTFERVISNRPTPSTSSWLMPACLCCGSSHYSSWSTYTRSQFHHGNYTYKEVKLFLCSSCVDKNDREVEQQKHTLRGHLKSALEHLLLADEIDPGDSGVRRNLAAAKEVAQSVNCPTPTSRDLRARLGVARRMGRREVFSTTPEDGVCFFCGKHGAKTDLAIRVPMCGDVRKEEFLLGACITWTSAEILVPRCPACHAAHRRLAQQTAQWEHHRATSTAASAFSVELDALTQCEQQLRAARRPRDGVVLRMAAMFSSNARGRLLRISILAKKRRALAADLEQAVAASGKAFEAASPPPALPRGVRPEDDYVSCPRLKQREQSGWGYGMEPYDDEHVHSSPAPIQGAIMGLVGGAPPIGTAPESALTALRLLVQDSETDAPLARPSPASIWRTLFSFTGRTTRSEFWLRGVLAAVLPVAVAVRVCIAWEAVLPAIALGGLALYVLAALFVRRLHDRNRSSKFLLYLLIPGWNYLHAVWLLVEVCVLGGTIGTNEYGDDPRGRLPRPPGGASFCFFCGRDIKRARAAGELPKEPNGDIGVSLYRVAARDGNFQATKVLRDTVTIPRCTSCQELHERCEAGVRRLGRIGAAIVGIPLVPVAGLLNISGMPQGDRLFGFAVAGALAGLVGGVIGRLCFRLLGRILIEERHLKGVAPLSCLRRHPTIEAKRSARWKIEKSSTATVTSTGQLNAGTVTPPVSMPADNDYPVVKGYKCPNCGSYKNISSFLATQGVVLDCLDCKQRFINGSAK